MNKTVISRFKDELEVKVMKEFVVLRAKTYAYLMDDDTKHKKAKGTKTCVIKRRLKKFFKNCLKIIQIACLMIKMILKLQQRLKSDYHNTYSDMQK